MRESTGRAMRIEELKEIIRISSEQGKYIDKKKMCAELSLRWNVAIRKVQEYLNLLIHTNLVLDTPDGLITPAAEQAAKIINSSPEEK